MLSVAEAIAAVLAEVKSLPQVRVALDDALGLTLAEEAVADLDSPPFDKALMDGYAVRSADLPAGRGRLTVIEEVLAGQVPHRPVGARQATRIMTGAPIPEGADAVVQVEHTRILSESACEEVAIETGPVKPGRSLLPRGASTRKGECVLAAGIELRSQELGCLAELGKSVVKVFPRPRVAVLATGDELVPVSEVPGPGQIRNSNETMLVAQLRRIGAVPVPLGIARDNPADLRARIAEGLKQDILLLSGGVSAGKLDLVPSVLAELGVRQVFHKVHMKPGQPLWFGAYPSAVSPGTRHKPPASPHHVFGLPGNPVSSMVCCELFVRTAVRRMMGAEPSQPVPFRARLAREHLHLGSRPTFHPAKLEWTADGPVVTPVRWIGSADLSATIGANSMILFSTPDHRYPPGDVVEVFPW
jgi:molybdopterin molybdotransferase